MTEPFLTGTGQFMQVHEAGQCAGEYCPVHNPSDHPLKDAPLLWRADRRLFERVCEHGVGHPDPDHIAFTERLRGKRAADIESVHGCCGCCAVEWM